MKYLPRLLTALLALQGLAVAPALAADFNVNTPDDIDPPGACEEAPGDCSLREAVIAANANTDGISNINLPAGTYTLTIAGANNDDATKGDLDILTVLDDQDAPVATRVIIQGAGANQTFIDGSGLVDDRVFQVLSSHAGDILDVTFNDITIRGGHLPLGGGSGAGILATAVDGPDSRVAVAINRSHITQNTNEDATFGGGLSAVALGTLKIDQSTFSANKALSGQGGGIYLEQNGPTDITSSTFSDNHANLGGAIAAYGVVNVEDPMLEQTYSEINIFNSTLTTNVAEGDGLNAGGVYTQTNVALTLSNTILAGNTAGDTGNDCGLSAETVVTSLGYNIIGDPTECKLPDGIEGDLVNTDPKLAALADNGGPTPTHAVPQDSPAFNSGNPGVSCDNGDVSGPTTDQRSFARIVDGRCDIGAYELVISDLSIVKVANAAEVKVGDGITYTLTVTNGESADTNVVVQDTLPAGVSFVSASSSDGSDNCAQAAGVVTCELGDLAPGEITTITVQTKAVNIGNTLNTATVEGDTLDKDPTNNTSSASVDVIAGNVVVPPVAGTLEGSSLCQLNPLGELSPLSFGALALSLALLAFRKTKRS